MADYSAGEIDDDKKWASDRVRSGLYQSPEEVEKTMGI